MAGWMGDLFANAFYEMAMQALIYSLGGLTACWCLIGPAFLTSFMWFWLPAVGSSFIIGLHYLASMSSMMSWFIESASTSAWYSSVAVILVALAYLALYVHGMIQVTNYIGDPPGQGAETLDLCNYGKAPAKYEDTWFNYLQVLVAFGMIVLHVLIAYFQYMQLCQLSGSRIKGDDDDDDDDEYTTSSDA